MADYDINNLAGAYVTPLILPVEDPATGLPQLPSDIFLQASPYTPETGWLKVGATGGPTQVGRAITTSGLTIEQSQTTLLERVNELTHTIQIPFAEFRPEILKLVNEGSIATIGDDPGQGAGKKVDLTPIEELTHYRVAFILRREKAQGVVTEGAGGGAKKRGRFLIFVAYDVTIQAENVQSSFGKGQTAQAPVTFKLYPVSAAAQDGVEDSYGYWFDEDPGVVPAVV